MATKQPEDFISFAERHSFSRSAELRHVTQPAFSGCIQSPEMMALKGHGVAFCQHLQ
jgi:DNA-binding transcriptional LysR family regulator